MSKAKFIEVVEQLFASNIIDVEAREYFEKTIKAKRVNAKEVEKATVIKQAIESVLLKSDKPLDRTEIANILYDGAEFPEEYLLNDKGTVAYNSITAFANQMVTAKILTKQEVKNGKFKRIVYAIAQ